MPARNAGTVIAENPGDAIADRRPRSAALAAAYGSVAGRRPVLLAGLGAACISASAVLVKLADTGTATVAFYRCLLAVPVLGALAVVEQRRPGLRQLAARRSAVLAGLFFAVDLVLWNHAIADVGPGIATVLGNLQVLSSPVRRGYCSANVRAAAS